MVKITVDKAVQNIGNRFDLVLIASARARQIQIKGKNPLINNHNHIKTTIIALKEIEQGLINQNIFKNNENNIENHLHITQNLFYNRYK
ncbi:DNA-directed RNA polymerase subunit omega [Enterobacteriaceae endosymbiont of Macroplea mutica]|uniref:DNA-directed RNA polymerase subunit omega n=1 Tax=Enterobacteriaceae endosymbiont of Macroplea mutica TaxID=2675791 RepID=UPI0014492969|nr:DNA-directed RNA polymerase subunit omega [Enterobacteriaceae endosymbiont of Macroplea mutica]QJC31432.1 DNA-directed RNA polymerase subunit omega [Enterobacteriaceae endosymbiont of Macroplea mutica]